MEGRKLIGAGLGLVLAATGWIGPAAADERVFRFAWEGAGGWEMKGALAFEDEGREVVLESDVTCFVIEGISDGEKVGRWALGQMTEETTWRLTFLPGEAAFAVYGPQTPMPQAWNMDGGGRDCGAGGFGFNIGNLAQDLCLDGRLIEASQVDPARPFPAEEAGEVDFPADACLTPPLMSSLR